MAEKRTNSVHVRLCDEADAVLELLAEARSSNKAAVAEDLIHRLLLGEGHSLRVAAMRFARLGLAGTAGDREGGRG